MTLIYGTSRQFNLANRIEHLIVSWFDRVFREKGTIFSRLVYLSQFKLEMQEFVTFFGYLESLDDDVGD